MRANWESLASNARTMMQQRHTATFQQFGLDFTIQYKWDLDRADIVFTRHDVPFVQADVQYLGSISRHAGTWLWGWANESIPPQATRRLGEIRQYGEQQGFEKLTTAEWVPQGNDGHEVMLVSACILGAPAFFHDHTEDLALFFVLDGFRCLEQSKA